MLAKPNPDVDLRDYLLYWFEDVFSQRIENTTRMVCAYECFLLGIHTVRKVCGGYQPATAGF